MKTIFEKSAQGHRSFSLRDMAFAPFDLESSVDASLLRTDQANLPEVSELDVVRHYTALSYLNKGIDNHFYPLGSCTMKYNPRLHEEMAAMPSFTQAHPLADASTVQGNMYIIYEVQRMLGALSGMDAFTLEPAAGAHGELTGLMLIKAYHQSRGEHEQRRKILIPDAAHGTNPSSAALCGYDVVSIRSDERGGVDMEHLKENLGDDVSGLMTTNPNTLGLFDENILDISSLVHQAGGLLYYDGANFNAIMGKCRPGDMGFDVIHINLHKTFSTPHGGGGPGAGPVGVKKHLIPFLPPQHVFKTAEAYAYSQDHEDTSIGRLMAFGGNFLVFVRAYVYMKLLGADGLKDVSESAVLNANYMMRALEKEFFLPYDRICMHEFVLSSKWQQEFGVHTKHLAKRLIDKGYYPPTIYFPLIVDEALMIEPTETESLETMDQFIEDLKKIAQECRDNPEMVQQAPHSTVVRQIDEVMAARRPKLRWTPDSV